MNLHENTFIFYMFIMYNIYSNLLLIFTLTDF